MSILCPIFFLFMLLGSLTWNFYCMPIFFLLFIVVLWIWFKYLFLPVVCVLLHTKLAALVKCVGAVGDIAWLVGLWYQCCTIGARLGMGLPYSLAIIYLHSCHSVRWAHSKLLSTLFLLDGLFRHPFLLLGVNKKNVFTSLTYLLSSVELSHTEWVQELERKHKGIQIQNSVKAGAS